MADEQKTEVRSFEPLVQHLRRQHEEGWSGGISLTYLEDGRIVLGLHNLNGTGDAGTHADIDGV